MNIIKRRSESVELKCFRILNTRYQLPEKDKLNYLFAEKGFEGELKLDKMLENLSSNCLVLQDLLLEQNNTVFQIDTLVIAQGTIFLFEVKNYDGVYYISNGGWFSENGKEIKNPIHQISRSETLLRQMIAPQNLNLNIQSQLIFVNPQFTLYEASKDLPVILPSQLNRFLDNLNKLSVNLTHKHNKLAHFLKTSHTSDLPYTRLPNYHYDQLQKGVVCQKCSSFMSILNRRNLICNDCGYEEHIEESVIRSIQEFNLLFPEKKVTVSAMMEWCKVIESKKTIRRILQKNYKLVCIGRFSNYV
ncbi:MAG: NERD domain-containing protein [Anaerobacillus sp.]|uniref:NERD domain-containing protein n=1 Tax=Anaerobacillus sp. TaxID=1872506 RepID=UPI00391B718C